MFYSQRLGNYSDTDPHWKMIGFAMLINFLLLPGFLLSLIIVASYIQAFILLALLSVTLFNFVLLKLRYFKKDDQKSLTEGFYSNDEENGKKESEFVFQTAVLTSWVSPCSVWANNFQKKTNFILLSSTITIATYVVFICAIVLAENQESFHPTHNHPITRCFRNADSFDSSIYRFCWKENCTISKLIDFCYEDCKPVVRICSESDFPAKQLTFYLFPIWGVLMLLSLVASSLLQSSCHHYKFVEFLVKTGSMGTDNFVNAFLVLWKSKQKIETDIKKMIKNDETKLLELIRIINTDTELHKLINEETNLQELTKIATPLKELIKKEKKSAKQNQNETQLRELTYIKTKLEDLINLKTNFDKLIRKETKLQQLMKDKVKESRKKTKIVENIFEIMNIGKLKTEVIDESENNLRKNLLSLRSNPSKGTSWQKPILHRLVENDQLFWFSFFTFFGGECGAKSGQEDSSINQLIDKLKTDVSKDQDPDSDSHPHQDQDSDHNSDQDPHHDQVQAQDQGKDKVQVKAESLLENQIFFVRYWIERLMIKYAEFALHNAAAKGDLQSIAMLIANSYDVNKKNPKEETPLHCAFEMPSVDTLRILIANGANMNAQNKQGKTPLHLALEKKDLDCFKFLLNNGADVKVKDEEGRTPLHYASEEDQLDFVKALVEKDVSGLLEKDNQDKTALHLAAEKGHKDCLKYLTEKTEDDGFQDDHGWDLLTKFANNYA
jgi:hypothetical protein